jgi:glucosylceramidase
MDVAFVNPNGETVVVAHNENDNPQAVAIRLGDRQFGYTLPGGALATFVWRGHSDDRPIDPTGWTATASPASATDVPANAVDDDASTRFSTGSAQQPGQYLQVDLGELQRVRKVVFDTGAATGDYPRGYAVSASADGETWWPVPAAGAGQFTTVDTGRRQIRYVRVTLAGESGSWWSVADVRAYR